LAKLTYRLKIFLWFMLAATALAGVFGFVNYTMTEDALERGMDASLSSAANLCAMSIEADDIPYLKLRGAVNSRISEKLKNIASGANLSNVYIINLKLEPVLSLKPDEGNALAGLDNYEIRKALAGKSIASPLFRTQNGYFKSAYAPVMKNNKVAAIAGVTASADYVKYIEDYRRALIFAVLVIIAVAAGLSFLLSYSITRSVKKLSRAASALSRREFASPVTINAEPEIMKLADALETMRKELASYINEREKMATAGEFAAGVAHEIRNALGSLQGRAELMLERATEEKAKNDTMEIIKNTRRMSGFLNNFLFYTKDFTPEFRKTNLKQFIEETVSELAPEVTSCVRYDGDATATAVIDPHLMKIAVNNVILNAYQAIDKEEKIIEIDYWPDMICVSDNGHGIKSEQRENIFKPFYTGRKSGTGLGLAIVYRIIKEIHKGEIKVEESAYKGAEFTFELTGDNK